MILTIVHARAHTRRHRRLIRRAWTRDRKIPRVCGNLVQRDVYAKYASARVSTLNVIISFEQGGTIGRKRGRVALRQRGNG